MLNIDRAVRAVVSPHYWRRWGRNDPLRLNRGSLGRESRRRICWRWLRTVSLNGEGETQDNDDEDVDSGWRPEPIEGVTGPNVPIGIFPSAHGKAQVSN